MFEYFLKTTEKEKKNIKMDEKNNNAIKHFE